MDNIIQSNILNELKLLSGKVAAIQNDLSVLSRKLSDHISSCRCHCLNHQCTTPDYPRSEENMSAIEHTDYEVIDKHNAAYNDQTFERPARSTRPTSPREGQSKVTVDGHKLCDTCENITHDHAVIAADDRGEDKPLLRRKSSKESKRECLRKSIQQNIVLLVESLTCSENEIIDDLIQSECLTETESSELRGSRKDCVRNLIRTVRGRSYNVLKNFVKCVEKLHPEVAESITQVYEKLLKDRKNHIRKCTFCDLKKTDSIKMVADHMWSIDAISEELYDEIVSGKKRTEELWEQLADEVNKGTTRYKTMKKLTEVLGERGHYQELASKLRKVSLLKCTCSYAGSSVNPSQLTLNIVVTDIDEMSTVSPVSTPNSSLSLVDENESPMVADDNIPANKHENYFLSSRAAVREKRDSCIGLRKSLTLNPNSIAVELRSVRSNSFGKSADIKRRTYALSKRRASMFV